ncbi:protein SQS1 [Yarrowia lipolytica]|uniref:Protein SQS1 n=1 Tax=Yarrowia lipolytica TaxID=4952 RepID=A0A371CC22_YARLL|nr:protein SQS1 [Yarrowia lipolytica]
MPTGYHNFCDDELDESINFNYNRKPSQPKDYDDDSRTSGRTTPKRARGGRGRGSGDRGGRGGSRGRGGNGGSSRGGKKNGWRDEKPSLLSSILYSRQHASENREHMFNKSLRGAEFITFIKSAEVYDPSKLLKDVGVTVEEANVVNEVEDIHIIVPEVIPEVQDVTGADAQLEDQESEDEEVVTTITETYADDGDNQEDDDDEMLVDGNGQLVDDYDDDEDDDDEDDEIDEEVDDDLIADKNAVDVSTLQDAINEVANDTINDDRKEEDPSEGSEADDEEDEAAEFVMDTEGDPDMVDMEFMETDFAYLNKKKRAEKSRTPLTSSTAVISDRAVASVSADTTLVGSVASKKRHNADPRAVDIPEYNSDIDPEVLKDYIESIKNEDEGSDAENIDWIRSALGTQLGGTEQYYVDSDDSENDDFDDDDEDDEEEYEWPENGTVGCIRNIVATRAASQGYQFMVEHTLDADMEEWWNEDLIRDSVAEHLGVSVSELPDEAYRWYVTRLGGDIEDPDLSEEGINYSDYYDDSDEDEKAREASEMDSLIQSLIDDEVDDRKALMDHGYTPPMTKSRGKNQVPNFGVNDPELQAQLEKHWVNSRAAKRAKREQRQAMRKQGMLTKEFKQGGIIPLHAKYPILMTVEEARKEIEIFINAPNKPMVLDFPPMGAEFRSVLKKLSACYHLKPDIHGVQKSKHVSMLRTSRTSCHNNNYIQKFHDKFPKKFKLVIRNAKYSTEQYLYETKHQKGSKRSAVRVHNREGEIVGHEAPAIDDSNIGRLLLQKMGWTTGEGLGAQSRGISEPIIAKVKISKRGIGA